MQQRHTSRTYIIYIATQHNTYTLSRPSSDVNMLRKKNISIRLSNNSQLCDLTCAPRPSTSTDMLRNNFTNGPFTTYTGNIY